MEPGSRDGGLAASERTDINVADDALGKEGVENLLVLVTVNKDQTKAVRVSTTRGRRRDRFSGSNSPRRIHLHTQPTRTTGERQRWGYVKSTTKQQNRKAASVNQHAHLLHVIRAEVQHGVGDHIGGGGLVLGGAVYSVTNSNRISQAPPQDCCNVTYTA